MLAAKFECRITHAGVTCVCVCVCVCVCMYTHAHTLEAAQMRFLRPLLGLYKIEPPEKP
jgi:hypothetical protein